MSNIHFLVTRESIVTLIRLRQSEGRWVLARNLAVGVLVGLVIPFLLYPHWWQLIVAMGSSAVLYAAVYNLHCVKDALSDWFVQTRSTRRVS